MNMYVKPCLLAFILLLITHLCNCNPVSCDNSCGIFTKIPYPFYIQDCPPKYSGEDLREFLLECSNGILFFPLQGSKQRYKVISFNTSGLFIDPSPDSNCQTSNLKTFNLEPYKRFMISPFNYIQLFNCSGRAPPGMHYCSIPSPTRQLQNCSQLHADGCLLSMSYKKEFSFVNCLSFTSWVLHNESDLSFKVEYGLKLDWALRGSCNNASCSANANCSSSTPLGYNCRCNDGFTGDGYTSGSACTTVVPICNRTLNTNCICEDGVNGSCFHVVKNPELRLKAAVGVLAAATIVAVFAIAWVIKKRKGSFILEEDLSKQQLESLLLVNKGLIKTECFSYRDLEKSTKYFSPKCKLGNGGFGTVYAARLSDGCLAAVKRIHFLSQQGFQQVVNEVNILSTVEHKNLVRLLGCCFQKVDPLIVFEYVPNGTLSDHLQMKRGEGLDWFMRISIATTTADALAYLHQMDPPIYHRDVKSANILLDYDFNVKVADFGLSRVALDDTEGSHISTVPQGTPGYLDPDYHRSYHLSDKSDVYSFGVVLIEIITALKPVDFSRDKKEVNLAALALTKIGNGSLHDIVDPFLQADKEPSIWAAVHRTAELAFRCLCFDKDARPTMLEVVEELNLIKNASAPVQDLSLCVDAPSLAVNNVLKTPRNAISLCDTDIVGMKNCLSPTSIHEPWESMENTPSESSFYSLPTILDKHRFDG